MEQALTVREAIDQMVANAERKAKLGKDNSAILRRIEVARGLQKKGNPLNYRGVHGQVITPEEREFLDLYCIIDDNPNIES